MGDTFYLRPGVNVADEIERDTLVRRRLAGQRNVQALLSETACWNRAHPSEPPIPYDDGNGSLRASCLSLGLDFDAMIATAESPPTEKA